MKWKLQFYTRSCIGLDGDNGNMETTIKVSVLKCLCNRLDS